jgi:hypothetical protein
MVSKTLTLGLVVAATVACAGPAQASVIDTDRPELNGTGYDFGNGTFVAGSPTGGGRLEFDLRLDAYADDAIDNMKISLQKKTASGWSTVESATYEVDTSDDKVKITEDGVDFGDLSFELGAPLGHGDMSWELDGAQVAPRLLGGLHLNNSSGVCARINLRYYTQAGSFLTKRADDEMWRGGQRPSLPDRRLQPARVEQDRQGQGPAPDPGQQRLVERRRLPDRLDRRIARTRHAARASALPQPRPR